MSANSNQEMDKDKDAEAKQQEEDHIHCIEKEEQEHELEEEQDQEKEKHTISDLPPTTRSSPPPPSQRDHRPPSPRSDSSSPSSLSSDLSSHGHDLRHSAAPVETPPVAVVNRLFQASPVVVAKIDPGAQDGFVSVREVEAGNNTVAGGSNRKLRLNLSILRTTRRNRMMKRALLVLRISQFLFCLISFSVMAADKNRGWALDSFFRYKELRYCLAVNVIGFAYSGLQAFDIVSDFTTGKHIVRHHLRGYFDFFMDQMLTYLLISASSSAATRVYDWLSNWGKDKFPEMASASVGFSFVAFLAFAASSLISGYALCKTS